jgi:cation/acetate symporter
MICLVYLVGTQFGGMELWFGVRNISSALFGLPAALVVTIAVSLMTKAPSKEMQDLVDSVRIPRGAMPALAAKAIQHDPAVR